MTRGEGACLVCGKPLTYFETARNMECVFCRKEFESYASCEDGHYVCDACHAAKGVETITEYCLDCGSKNPVEILQAIMDTPYIYMHGPEHHIMVGAAVSTGMFMSIVTGATPLTGKSWGQSNRMTSKALQAIGDIGGPRCCKRNSFTAVRMAVDFVREKLGIAMELPEKIICTYADENKQCLRNTCPYHQE